jgi:nickel/cobalt exporter
MSSSLAITLATAAAGVGALHSLAPDHWLPISAVSRARSWTMSRTARVALLCGIGHVTVSAALGLLALVTGRSVVEAFGSHVGSIAGLLMIAFGVGYAIWGSRHYLAHKLHGHHHAHFDHVHGAEKTSVRALFAIYCADPCVAVIPIIIAAAPLSMAGTIAIVLVYELATLLTMVGLVLASRAGIGVLRAHWIEHHGDTAAGGLIALTGIVVAIVGI